jgi:dTDP-4-dehydrorhamnose reductase
MKVLILGSTGMLGNAVAKEFSLHGIGEITKTLRRHTLNKEDRCFDATKHDLSTQCGADYDYVINCIGVIKPFINDNPYHSVYVNGAFPHKLSSWAKKNDIKMIHITTDCVFSGKDGNYTEESVHDEVDFYGKSKSLGEPKDCMVLRTSIIGEEIHKDASLIAWVKSQEGNTINGFTNHLWNGVTTNQYGKICMEIMKKGLYEEGLFHVFSPTPVNKFELVSSINDRFNLNITIVRTKADLAVDRTLSTNEGLNGALSIPEIPEQIKNL